MAELKHTICRACHAGCGVLVEVDDGIPVSVRGNANDPLFKGFCCIKGQNFHATRNIAERLLHSQKRQADGSYQNIPVAQAMDEIAAKLHETIEKHGPRSLATYSGTMAANSGAVNSAISTAFLKATGSRMGFNSNTIDQPGKMVASALHGRWMAPSDNFAESDVLMLVGVNPLVAMSGGIPHHNPGRYLTDALNQGLTLIVIDPRRSETARRAQHFLQIKPGEDVPLLAAMLYTILDEQLHDAGFCAQEIDGLESLRKVVRLFPPETVACRTGLDPDAIRGAARAFANAKRGVVTAGTGPNMSGHTTLLEYLVLNLNSVCGRWQRAGDTVFEPASLGQATLAKAQAQPPYPEYAYGFGEKMSVRGLSNTAAGLPTAALADEILRTDAQRVRALISHGGNPLAAWPDQIKTIEAYEALELSVQIDVTMSATARQADYVIAVKHPLETVGTSLAQEYLSGYAVGFGAVAAYAHYTPAIADAPEHADVIEDWEFFYGLAQRMNLQLTMKPVSFNGTVRVPGHQIDMKNPPTTDELLDRLTEGSRIPITNVRNTDGGGLFPEPKVTVADKDSNWQGRLDVANEQMMKDLHALAFSDESTDGQFPFALIARRQINVLNSTGLNIPGQTRGKHHNPAFMHPSDIAELGLKDGQAIRIESRRAAITGIVEADSNLRRGLVSMSHCWGDTPETDDRYADIGGNTGRLSSVEYDFEPYTGLPRMSNIPVRLSAL